MGERLNARCSSSSVPLEDSSIDTITWTLRVAAIVLDCRVFRKPAPVAPALRIAQRRTIAKGHSNPAPAGPPVIAGRSRRGVRIKFTTSRVIGLHCPARTTHQGGRPSWTAELAASLPSHMSGARLRLARPKSLRVTGWHQRLPDLGICPIEPLKNRDLVERCKHEDGGFGRTFQPLA
jgi:hypothetical protein